MEASAFHDFLLARSIRHFPFGQGLQGWAILAMWGVRGLPLLPCPERHGSGGIQSADGWSRFQGRHAFGQGSIRAERPLCRGGLPRGGNPCRSVRAEAVKAGSRGRIWRPIARSTIADCITAPFCRFSLRPADRPERLHAARFFARGRQRTNRRKRALRANLRGHSR